MQDLPLKITIGSNLYLKNPESSDLGQRIVTNSIELIHELGFEAFTFKKLGQRIGSNESSIYRYFESKHMVLLYLISWYWSWLEYRLAFSTSNIKDPEEQLRIAIRMISQKVEEDHAFTYINEVKLFRIIIDEGSKAYYTKAVDKENELGFFKPYKRLVKRISNMVLDVNPTFKYPNMLVSTVIEGTRKQRYFQEHIPALSNLDDNEDCIVTFFESLVLNSLNIEIDE